MFDELTFFVDLIKTSIKSNSIIAITNNLNETFDTSYTQDQVRDALIDIDLERHQKKEEGELCLNNLFHEFY